VEYRNIFSAPHYQAAKGAGIGDSHLSAKKAPPNPSGGKSSKDVSLLARSVSSPPGCSRAERASLEMKTSTAAEIKKPAAAAAAPAGNAVRLSETKEKGNEAERGQVREVRRIHYYHIYSWCIVIHIYDLHSIRLAKLNNVFPFH